MATLAFYPKFEVLVGDSRVFLSMNEAIRTKQSQLCGTAIESDGTSRSITPNEVRQFTEAVREWTQMSA